MHFVKTEMENQIEEKIKTILGAFKDQLGKNYSAYKNHLIRVILFCSELKKLTEVELEKIIVAASFHDLGLWTENTLDYLTPSETLAEKYLQEKHLSEWKEEIVYLISEHHKLTPYKNQKFPLVEIFRKADLIDLSMGLISYGISSNQIKTIKRKFPNEGFHKFLFLFYWKWLLRNPLHPFPILKW
jgi:hypothetical protein